MKLRVPIHVYRLRYPNSPNAPEMLWEWDKPHIDRLLWNALTFGRTVVQCAFVDWHTLVAANERIWETAYQPRALYAQWPTWYAWLDEYRALVATTQEVYELQYGVQRDDANIEPSL
jgi:hypothetical protein